MPPTTSKDASLDLSKPPSPPPFEGWPTNLRKTILYELKMQRGIAFPLGAMNLTWFAKIAITTAFLGRLGELQLAGGTLGFTFANVTGFSVLTGLCGAMEPICGQAFGAGNRKLLHKTLLMATLLLLLATIPISFLWINVDRILIRFGQKEDISSVAKTYVAYLLPDLVITSFLCPLKAYLSSQSITVPIMFSSTLALAIHVPIIILLSKSKGLEGVAMSVWLTDLIVAIMLAMYVLVLEWRNRKVWNDGGWLDQWLHNCAQLLKLSGPCCLTTCLEWWCYEILVLLTGHLADAKQSVAVLAIVLNFDYLLYSIMLSLATSVSVRVSNELGANRAQAVQKCALVSLAASVFMGCLGGLAMVCARGPWGTLYSHDKGVVRGVKKMMLLMGLVEVVNFPISVCGGIVRGTARPLLGLYANLGGFYLVALPLGVVLAFKVELGLGGLLLGFLSGMIVCVVFLVVLVVRIDWVEEAAKAQKYASGRQVVAGNEAGVEAPVHCETLGNVATSTSENKRVLLSIQ